MASLEQQSNQYPDGITLMEIKLGDIKARAVALQEDLVTTFDTGIRFRKAVKELRRLDRIGTILEFAIEQKRKKG